MKKVVKDNTQSFKFCPIKIENERKKRGKEQKIFLILTHEYDEDILERKYEVMGTTCNAYTVIINSEPTCTCPDFTQRNHRCKHIYFVLTKIMKVAVNQEDILKYSVNNLLDMFTNIPIITENLKIDPIRLKKYKNLKKNGNGEVVARNIDEDDICPICMGDMYDCSEELTFCKYSCGTSIHKQCFDIYCNNKVKNSIVCLYCHKNWTQEEKLYINIQ
jgi:hypothetical protein